MKGKVRYYEIKNLIKNFIEKSKEGETFEDTERGITMTNLGKELVIFVNTGKFMQYYNIVQQRFVYFPRKIAKILIDLNYNSVSIRCMTGEGYYIIGRRHRRRKTFMTKQEHEQQPQSQQ